MIAGQLQSTFQREEGAQYLSGRNCPGACPFFFLRLSLGAFFLYILITRLPRNIHWHEESAVANCAGQAAQLGAPNISRRQSLNNVLTEGFRPSYAEIYHVSG